jgi:hypothetical protein
MTGNHNTSEDQSLPDWFSMADRLHYRRKVERRLQCTVSTKRVVEFQWIHDGVNVSPIVETNMLIARVEEICATC